FNGFARPRNVLGAVHAGLVLLVNDASEEDGRGLVVRIEVQRALGVRLSVFEMPLFVGDGTFVQLVFRSYFIDEPTAGTGDDKQCQDRCRADPGPGESHSISSVFNERYRPSGKLRKPS